MDVGHYAQDADANQAAVKPEEPTPKARQRMRSRRKDGSIAADESAKRRCVSTACIGRAYAITYITLILTYASLQET